MSSASTKTAVVLPPIKWASSPNASARRGAHVGLVVVHRPVGSYRGAIATMRDRDHEASAHAIIREDGHEATQLVEWSRKAWACRAFNSVSDNIETPDWIWTGPLTPDALRVMHIVARCVAMRLHVRGLPARHVRGRELVHNPRGFTFHVDLGAIGGGHTDPTTDPHRTHVFGALVAAELHRGGFRPSWGRT